MANGKIKGDLLKQTSGDLVDAWGAGYFVALKFNSDMWDRFSSVKVGLRPTYKSGLPVDDDSGLVEVLTDPDKNGAFKVTSPNDQKFKVVATAKDGTVLTSVYDFELDGYYYDEEEHDYVIDTTWGV